MVAQQHPARAHGGASWGMHRLRRAFTQNMYLYLLLVPGVLYFVVFRYAPMFGIVIAFQDYNIYRGVAGSDWVGLSHFIRLFQDPAFYVLLRNTLMIAIVNLVFYFPIPVALALMLHEVKHKTFKRTVQTLIYVPHFISWVVIYAITYAFLARSNGALNDLLAYLGMERVSFLTSPAWFRTIVVGQAIWRNAGWGTIIFLAALSNVNPELYEQIAIDGGSRRHRLVYVTLPAIQSTVVVLLILRMGQILSVGFEQILLLLNPLNRSVGEVFSTYVYRIGILGGQFSYTTAIGLFNSLVGLIMIITANALARRLGEASVF